MLGLQHAGLAMARGLGRAGITVVGVTLGRREFGLRSRYLARRVVVDTEGGGLDRRLLAVLGQHGGAGRVVLFPERDVHIEVVQRNWDAVRALAETPLPELGVARRLGRKDALLAAAAEAGIETPRTLSPSAAGAIGAIDWHWPAVVKPVEGDRFAYAFGRKALLAQNVYEAVEAWRLAQELGFETVVQEVVPDADEQVFSLLAYIGRGGDPLACVVGRKLRQVPIRFGTSSVFTVDHDEQVLELGLRLLRTVQYQGIAHVEFVRDPRDGVLRLLEVNLRFPVWGGLAVTRRLNIAQIAYDDLCGVPPRPMQTIDGPLTWIYLGKDLWGSLQLARRRQLTVAEFIAPYLRRDKVRATFDWRDPLPVLASLPYLRMQAGRHARAGR